MLRLLRLLSVRATRFFSSRRDLILENLALQQQLGILKQRHPQTQFATADKLFWVILLWLSQGWELSPAKLPSLLFNQIGG